MILRNLTTKSSLARRDVAASLPTLSPARSLAPSRLPSTPAAAAREGAEVDLHVTPNHPELVPRDPHAFDPPASDDKIGRSGVRRFQRPSRGILESFLHAIVEAGSPTLIERRAATFSPESRIAVIGAGPGGLAAAEFLKKYGGYKNVQLLEAGPDVGGRVLSFTVSDAAGEPLKGKNGEPLVYEYGAGLAMSGYKELELLLDRSDVQLIPPVSSQVLSKDAGGPVELLSVAEKLRLPFEAAWFLAKSVLDWRSAHRPSYAHLDRPELQRSVAETIGDRVPTLLKVAAGPVLGFGYDQDWRDMPLATGLKYIRPRQIIGNDNFLFPQGFQKMFQDVARNHDVVTGCRVNSVRRDGDALAVDTSQGPMQFDKVIWTAPLQHAASVLKSIPPALKAEMNESITSVNYRAFVCRMQGLPQGVGAFYFLENLNRNGTNRPMFMYNAHPDDADVVMAYAIAERHVSDAEVVENIKADVAAVGGQVTDVIDRKSWDYFPHGRPGKLEVFKKLQSFQGTDGVYLAGAGMEFDTTNDAVRASGVVVNDYFLQQPPRAPRGTLAMMLAHREMQTLP